jgi:phosphoserine phosphatase RsbU/P
MMSQPIDSIDDLNTLNDIALTLNRAVDVGGALNDALARLVELMGLDAGWIFLRDPSKLESWQGKGFRLAAHYNLPPAMDLDSAAAWSGGCDCQGYCTKGKLIEAYNEIRCSRLAAAQGDKRDLQVHASSPLRSGTETLGILNVAGRDWESFDSRALALLTNVGGQMGVALERARLYEMLRDRRVHEQAALLAFSNQLLGRLDLDELMTFLLESVMELLSLDAAALALLDRSGEYLVFRASAGWRTDPVAEGRRVPADDRSSSGWAMRHQQPVILTYDMDRQAIPVWTSEWLRAEEFRVAVIVPMIAEDRAIGTLTVDTRHERKFDEDELRFVQLMANQAAIAIEKARLHRAELARHVMEEELALGRRIQLSLLPLKTPQVPGWEFADYYQAARQVGGDFYDFFFLEHGHQRLGLVIADVSDKGVPAALFMAVSKTLIRTIALSGLEPAAVLQTTNRLLRSDSRSEMFLSAFYAILDVDGGLLHYANAGHNPPLCYRAASDSFERLDAEGIVLGVVADAELEQGSATVDPGDVVIFYTDGVTEAMNEALEEFGLARLQEAVAASAGGSAQQVLQAIGEAVSAFTGDTDQSDDLTLFVFKRL